MIGTLAGDTLTYGPGRTYRDGSLGCIGCGAIAQPGAYRSGSLGLVSGSGRVYRSGSLGTTGLDISGKFVFGLLLGAVGVYLVKRPPKFLRKAA